MKLAQLLPILFVGATSVALADVKLPAVFAHHLVLQRDQPVPIWGFAEPGESVTVEFGGQQKSVVADTRGTWSVKLDALPASAESRTLTVTAKNKVTLSDVLVGEVWLASGQSNMAFPVSSAHNATAVLAVADDPLLRFFTVQHATAAEPQSDLRGKWEPSTPATVKSFSAVAYFFARELRAKVNCPVAILHSSWGGTPAQTWLSLDALRQDPPFAGHLKKWEAALDQHRKVIAQPALAAAYREELAHWQTEIAPAFNAALKAHTASKSTAPKPTPARPEPANPDPMGLPSPSARPSTPSVIFNAQIAPLTRFAIRGALWYQGEANGGAGLEYRTLLPRLIGDWRAHWAQGNFPFLIVQLPGWNHDSKPAEVHDWPWLREAQALTAQNVPHTGLAVTIDLGDPADVHPKNKVDVAHRLFLVARQVAYGENLVSSGPIFRELTITGSTVRVKFSHLGGGLTIGRAPWSADDVSPTPTDRLIGFRLAGEDRIWHDAVAEIADDSVIVSSPAVPAPVAVRYAWANSPRANLYNRENLPAAPFRSDTWPLPSKP